MKTFDQDLDRAFKKKVVLRATELVKGLVMDLYRNITANSATAGFQFGSPVLTGQYYTNHNISINRIDTKTVYRKGAKDKPLSGLSLAKAQLTLRNFKLGDTVFIANSLPYAQRIEEGWSRFKTPRGVYRVATELIKVKYKNVKLLNVS